MISVHSFVQLVWVTIQTNVLLWLFTDIIIFYQLSHIIVSDVHTNYTKYDI